MASGSPSRRLQISAIVLSVSSVVSRPGLTNRARSKNSATPLSAEGVGSVKGRGVSRTSKRLDREWTFRSNAQEGPTRHKKLQARADCQQVGQERCRVDHLLKVVKDQQELFVLEILNEYLAGRPRIFLPQLQSLGDFEQHLSRGTGGFEGHEHDAIGEILHSRACDFQSETRFSDARRPGARQQSHIVAPQKLARRRKLLLPSHQSRPARSAARIAVESRFEYCPRRTHHGLPTHEDRRAMQPHYLDVPGCLSSARAGEGIRTPAGKSRPQPSRREWL